jgi:gliding motility-associated-like protein
MYFRFHNTITGVPKKSISLLCFLLLPALCVTAQRGNVWYFGRLAALDFNTTPVTALTNSAMVNEEGTSSICNENGQLLFYTDANIVYNAEHQPMPNGSGLQGHRSAYQSCVIVPKPGDTSTYYIFTADAWETSGAKGYRYSTVDMRLDNGRGDITAKNIALSGPSSERLTAVKASNGIDYWVITNTWLSNEFKVYKVDCNGVNPTPVVSTVGSPLNENTNTNIGAMKVSPDGRFLIQTNGKGRNDDFPGDEYAQLFDFNNLTGAITNPRAITMSGEGFYWGCEFSPDSRMLYLVNAFPVSRAIHQFNVSSGNIAAIMASKYVIPVTSNTQQSGIQSGPDGRLYINTSVAKLHVINNPNNAGAACNYVQNQVDLKNRTSGLALPNIIPNFLAGRPVDFTTTILDSCGGRVQFNSIINIAAGAISWDFGDGNTSGLPNPVHTFSNPGTEYLVKLRVKAASGCGEEVISKRIVPGGILMQPRFGITLNCPNKSVTLRDSSFSTGNIVSYEWNFGDGTTATGSNPSHTYGAYGNYMITLKIRGATACAVSEISLPLNLTLPVISAGGNRVVDFAVPVQLQATGADSYSWSPGDQLSNPRIANPILTPYNDITYLITGKRSDGCSGTAQLRIEVNKTIYAEVPTAFTPDSNGRNDALKPLLRGIRTLNAFKVYNRWGQVVFETTEMDKGWNGTLKGRAVDTDVYLWILEVTDYNGRVIKRTGSTVLVR